MLALSSILVFFTTFLAAGLAALIGWFALQRMGAEAVAEDVFVIADGGESWVSRTAATQNPTKTGSGSRRTPQISSTRFWI